MSFNSNIPIVTDPLIKSQKQTKANFQAINRVFSENHVAMNREFQGMHNALVLREQIADPVTTATQIALYAKAVTLIPQLFFAPNNSQTPIQLTYNSISTGLLSSGPDVYLQDQYSFIAGPFIVYAGIMVNITSGTVKNLTPTSSIIYAGASTLVNKNSNLTTPALVISGSGFTVQYSSLSGVQTIYYLAIGKP